MFFASGMFFFQIALETMQYDFTPIQILLLYKESTFNRILEMLLNFYREKTCLD